MFVIVVSAGTVIVGKYVKEVHPVQNEDMFVTDGKLYDGIVCKLWHPVKKELKLVATGNVIAGASSKDVQF